MEIFNKKLRAGFEKLGESVGTYPKYYLISSLVISLLLCTGLFQIKYERNIEELYRLIDGASETERSTMLKYFATNESGHFNPSRLLKSSGVLRVIIEAKDDRGSLLHSDVWEEIEDVDNLVQSVNIINPKNTDQWLNYSQLCASWDGKCYENDFLDLGQVIPQIENETLRVGYPVMFNPETFKSYALALSFGGIEFTSEQKLSIKKAKALQLHYFVENVTPEDDLLRESWENAVIDAFLAASATGKWKKINVYFHTYESVNNETEKNSLSVLPHFAVSIFMSCIFIVLTTLSRDWVIAKPVVALYGILTTGLGTLAAAGVLAFFGVPTIGINLAVPFVMLGIGVDDTFVILSAWRQTNILDPVPKRLAHTYGDAAVSITITSLTDMLSFWVGLLTPIRSVQLFCAHAGFSVLGIYLLQILSFGAVLAYSGFLEAKNRHSIFWWIEATPKSKSHGKSKLHQLFLTGGIDKADPNNPINKNEHAVMIFFRDSYSKFIQLSSVKFLVIVTFIVYLFISVWGVQQMDEGLREERMFSEDSYCVKFLTKEYEYFRKYPYRVQVAITKPLDYANTTTQVEVQSLLNQLINSSPYVTSEYQENWLQSYTDSMSRWQEIDEDYYNISTEKQFINILQNEYLPQNIFAEDVKFDSNNSKIIASRYILQTEDVISSKEIRKLVTSLREITDLHQNVTIFHPFFNLVDQWLHTQSLAIKLVGIAAAVVMAVSVIFIPNLICALTIFLTIGSTGLGVLGFMALWGVSLDIISTICLIMVVGFSVDFSAHISFLYITTPGTPSERLEKTLYSLGFPIIQGGLSTIIGVTILVFVRSYIFECFFKIVFLVIVFSIWHGLFLLPVALLIINPESRCKSIVPNKDTGTSSENSSVSEVNVKFDKKKEIFSLPLPLP